MKNSTAVSSNESTLLILCKLGQSPTEFVLQYNQWFHDGLNFFFHYHCVRSVPIQSYSGYFLFPCSLLFVLHLEWFLNTSVHKKSNAVCIFANLCSTLVCDSNFFQLGSIFCRNTQMKTKKANREN